MVRWSSPLPDGDVEPDSLGSHAWNGETGHDPVTDEAATGALAGEDGMGRLIVVEARSVARLEPCPPASGSKEIAGRQEAARERQAGNP